MVGKVGQGIRGTSKLLIISFFVTGGRDGKLMEMSEVTPDWLVDSVRDGVRRNNEEPQVISPHVNQLHPRHTPRRCS